MRPTAGFSIITTRRACPSGERFGIRRPIMPFGLDSLECRPFENKAPPTYDNVLYRTKSNDDQPLVLCLHRIRSFGITLSMNCSSSGTVKAVSPWAAVEHVLGNYRVLAVGATEDTEILNCSAMISPSVAMTCKSASWPGQPDEAHAKEADIEFGQRVVFANGRFLAPVGTTELMDKPAGLMHG